MAITKQEVEHVARLARLELKENESELFTEQLSQILAQVEKLKNVSTENVAPCAHPFTVKDHWREDVSSGNRDTSGILANAPDREENLFKVPKVIE